MSTALVRSPGNIANLLLRARRWVILAMLLSLHAALVSPAGGDFERTWLMVHFGLFLLWQPFISTDREIKVFTTSLLLGITGVVLYTLAGWMLVTWVTILIGIMGGKVFTSQAARRSRFYLVAVFYLFTILLTWTVPVSLLDLQSIPQGLGPLITLFLPLVLIAMVFLPFRAEDETTAQVFDFFYSLFVFQLVVVLILGSIAAMRVTDNQYFQAVLLTVLAFAGALFLLALLWGPRAGFGGLRTYFSRYLMSVGMPFELWMRRIAELSEAEMSSSRFLENAMDEVATTTWISGCTWISPDGNDRFGRETAHSANFRYHDLDVTFFTDIRLSPALFLHLRLLAQVVGEFYEGKRREQVMKQNAYMQAVHETGARLTHDIKNLLQSLYALTSMSIAQQEASKPDLDRRTKSSFESLLERQLPHLTKRLQTTLDKLKNPAVGTTGFNMRAGDWWQEVTLRHAGSGASFKARGDMNIVVPAALFDTVLENCLENARKKKERETEIHITIEFSGESNPSLAIADTGSAIPSGAVENLFRAPVANTRRSGLGIGLFQAYRQAEQAGYELKLGLNEPGNVRFDLARMPNA
jgi:signal transduction histidine kinase